MASSKKYLERPRIQDGREFLSRIRGRIAPLGRTQKLKIATVGFTLCRQCKDPDSRGRRGRGAGGWNSATSTGDGGLGKADTALSTEEQLLLPLP